MHIIMLCASSSPNILNTARCLIKQLSINDQGSKIRCIILSGSRVPQSLLDKCKKYNLNICISATDKTEVENISIWLDRPPTQVSEFQN